MSDRAGDALYDKAIDWVRATRAGNNTLSRAELTDMVEALAKRLRETESDLKATTADWEAAMRLQHDAGTEANRLADRGAQCHRHRDYTITCSPKPIPIRDHDWEFVHDDYDGAPVEPGGPPADPRAGTAASLEEAKREIDLIEEDRE